MADRNTVQKGYSYRDSSTDIKADRETPEQTFQSGGVSSRQTTDLRRPDQTPVVDALLRVAGNELKELKKAGDIQQGTEGAIRAGKREGMDAIRKRGSAMDWVFGTRAKTHEAAAVHSAIKVTEWSASSLEEMPDMQQVDPDDYAELKGREIADAADAIDDPDLKAAFLHQGNQRLAQLVAIQMEQNHDYLQNKASNDYQIDLKARLGHLQELEAIGGIAYEIAKEELNTFFETRPEGMTIEAHQAAIAKAIIAEALEGRRELYEYADAQGMLDNMPEEMRTELEEKYKQAAPKNDPKFIAAIEQYLLDMLNPSISVDEFERRQLKFIADRDTVHRYSDEQLASHRVRHRKSKASATKSAFDLARGVQAFDQKDNAYIASLSGPQKQKVAVEWMQQQFRNALTEQEKLYWDAQSIPKKNSLLVAKLGDGMLSEDPNKKKQATDLFSRIADHTGKFGVRVSLLEDVFETSTTTLMDSNGNPNPNAARSLAMLSEYKRLGNEGYLDKLVDKDTLARVVQYDSLIQSGQEPEAALGIMADQESRPYKPATGDQKTTGRKRGVFKFNDNVTGTYRGSTLFGWGSTPDVINIADVNDELDVTSEILRKSNPGLSVKDSYEAAGIIVAGNREMIGPHAISKGSEQSLSTLLGFREQRDDLEEDLSDVFTRQGGEGLPVKGSGGIKWDEVDVVFNMQARTVTIIPFENIDGSASYVHEDREVLPFSEIVRMLEPIAEEE